MNLEINIVKADGRILADQQIAKKLLAVGLWAGFVTGLVTYFLITVIVEVIA